MQIQWFPGHMHKARKEMQQVLPKVDLVIEVLDARIPFSSANPLLAALRRDKPCIKLLAKSDLADPAATADWQLYLEREQHLKTLATTTLEPERIRLVSELCHKLLPGKAAPGRPLVAMIMGIPNVGKSTLINLLAGRVVAKTGNEPAVTRAQQRIRLDNDIVLLDTPGMLWPNVENRHSGYRLAITGAIRDTAMDYAEVALFAAGYMRDRYPERLRERYQLDTLPEADLELVEAVGARRGCLGRGGRIDLTRAATVFIHDIRAGQLGRLTFESPADMERELAELEILRAEKAAARAERDEARRQGRKP